MDRVPPLPMPTKIPKKKVLSFLSAIAPKHVLSSCCQIDPMELRVPKSSRYEHVRPRTSSGFNILRLEEAHALIAYKYRREEHFKRVTRKDLATVLESNPDGFLVLDLRPLEEYDLCHIRGGFLSLVVF
jgi:hypothetical protein